MYSKTELWWRCLMTSFPFQTSKYFMPGPVLFPLECALESNAASSLHIQALMAHRPSNPPPPSPRTHKHTHTHAVYGWRGSPVLIAWSGRHLWPKGRRGQPPRIWLAASEGRSYLEDRFRRELRRERGRSRKRGDGYGQPLAAASTAGAFCPSCQPLLAAVSWLVWEATKQLLGVAHPHCVAWLIHLTVINDTLAVAKQPVICVIASPASLRRHSWPSKFNFCEWRFQTYTCTPNSKVYRQSTLQSTWIQTFSLQAFNYTNYSRSTYR